MIIKKFKVEKKHAEKRLDLYLAIAQTELSRSGIRTLINLGDVRINDEVNFKPNYKVKVGDAIELKYKPKVSSPKIVPQNIPINVIYEDEYLLAVDKPTGQVVHPATGHWEKTLMNAVTFHRTKIKTIGEQHRAGLIHRLDKDTSGIVLIGKSNEALWYYSKLFADRKVEKTYIAVVAGNIRGYVKGDEITIKNYLGRNKRNRKKITEVLPAEGRLSISSVKVLKTLNLNGKEISIVLVVPKTGRTHQIRVHLSGIGYPILGDTIYGRKNKFKRLMLHAWKIKLKDINGKLLSIESELPEEIKKIFSIRGEKGEKIQ